MNERSDSEEYWKTQFSIRKYKQVRGEGKLKKKEGRKMKHRSKNTEKKKKNGNPRRMTE